MMYKRWCTSDDIQAMIFKSLRHVAYSGKLLLMLIFFAGIVIWLHEGLYLTWEGVLTSWTVLPSNVLAIIRREGHRVIV